MKSLPCAKEWELVHAHELRLLLLENLRRACKSAMLDEDEPPALIDVESKLLP